MDKVSGRSLGSGWGSPESRTHDCHLVLPPCAHQTPPVAAAGDRDPDLGHQHLWDGDPESPFPSAAPLCGSTITALPLLLQLLHEQQGTAPPSLCSVLTPFPNHSVNPSNPTHHPTASPSPIHFQGCSHLLQPLHNHIQPHVSGGRSASSMPHSTAWNNPLHRASHKATTTEQVPAETPQRKHHWIPPASSCHPSAPVWLHARVQHLWKHHPGSWDAAWSLPGQPQPSTCSQRDPKQGHPAAIALFFHSSVTSSAQGARREVRE